MKCKNCQYVECPECKCELETRCPKCQPTHSERLKQLVEEHGFKPKPDNGPPDTKGFRIATLKIDNEKGTFSGTSPFPDDLMLFMGLRRVEEEE